MFKLIFNILVIVAIVFALYKYFHLDENQAFQHFFKNKDFKGAEEVVKDVVSNKIKEEAKKYVYENNSYFVSKTNNLCVALQKNVETIKIGSNPIECVAKEHTFTARIKTLTQSYYCADISGFYSTSLNESGYKEGVSCK